MTTSAVKADTAPRIEVMDAPAWKQTVKDLPVAVLAGAIGYGVSRTALELYGNHLMRTGQKFPLAKATPQIVAALTAGLSIAQARQRGILKDRRDQARAEAAGKTGKK